MGVVRIRRGIAQGCVPRAEFFTSGAYERPELKRSVGDHEPQEAGSMFVLFHTEDSRWCLGGVQ